MIDLYNGDCLEVMKNLPTRSVDLVVTDPPYDIHAGKGGGAFGNRKAFLKYNLFLMVLAMKY